MMSDCKHEDGTRYAIADVYVDNKVGPLARIDGTWRTMVIGQQRCSACGAVVPYGPARDTAETAVEIRAAEMAAPNSDSDWTLSEAFGWRLYRDGTELLDTHSADVRSGYLAAAMLDEVR